jgi:hypothetical protein
MSITFRQYLSESITLDEKTKGVKYYKQSQREASDAESISTFALKTGYISQGQDLSNANYGAEVPVNKVISLYSYKSKDGSQSSSILKALKGIGEYSVDDLTYSRFIRDSVNYAIDLLNREKPDFIIYPVSSSRFLKDFIDKLEEKMVHIEFIKDVIVKKHIKDIDKYVDEMIDKEYYGYKKMTPDKIDTIKKAIIRNVRKNEEEGKGPIVTLKGIGLKRDVHLVKNFMEIVDDEILKIEGKHVIIIDDVLSTGTSFKDMIRAVGEFSPASVNGLTIFKRG